jgi:hypothetical protein
MLVLIITNIKGTLIAFSKWTLEIGFFESIFSELQVSLNVLE